LERSALMTVQRKLAEELGVSAHRDEPPCNGFQRCGGRKE